MVTLLFILLSGCAAQETFETISDVISSEGSAQMLRMSLSLPQDAAAPTVESDDARLYQCGTYSICIETLSGGDIEKTIEQITGYASDELTVMQTQRDGFDCYEFVWVSAGENGDQVGRALVLDDGNYHYAVSTLTDADHAQEHKNAWDAMFQSASLDAY